MGKPEADEPVTPAGRLFFRPEMNQIIHCLIGVTDPIDVEALKTEVRGSAMVVLPRFTSILVTDSLGVERWRRTEVDVDQHVIIVGEPVGEGETEEVFNDYVADLAVSTPLAVDKPLWELHLLMAHNCILLRVHHALGDGISLMSLLLSLCRRSDDPNAPVTTIVASSESGAHARNGTRERVWRVLKAVWFTFVFLLGFILRCLWLSDSQTAVSGGDGVEMWPRKLVTARFRLQDMKAVKKAVAGATINDVLFGVVASGLSKYLEIRTPKGLPEGLQMTGLAMVNLRKQSELQDLQKPISSKWGNKFGMMLLPVYYHQTGGDPLQFVKRTKRMIDQKKLSLEAHLSYHIGNFVMSAFGVKAACRLNYRIICNTTFTISNVVGPQENITSVNNSIKYLRATSTALPHAITMHMVSYAGRADMQILVAKDIIPDPKILAKCFEDALLEMKDAAEALEKR